MELQFKPIRARLMVSVPGHVASVTVFTFERVGILPGSDQEYVGAECGGRVVKGTLHERAVGGLLSGHASILTTQKYLHTLPDLENDVALDAFAKIRNRSKADAQAKNGRCA